MLKLFDDFASFAMLPLIEIYPWHFAIKFQRHAVIGNLMRIKIFIEFFLIAVFVTGCAASQFTGTAFSLPTLFPTAESAQTSTPLPLRLSTLTVTSAPHNKNPRPVLRSTPGLKEALSEDKPSYWEIRHASFIDMQRGWALFNDTYFFQTSDGGETWIELPRLDRAFIEMQFVNPTTGWAILPDGLYKTTDVGHSWELVLDKTFAGWQPVMTFVDEKTGFLTFDGSINRTTDGGKTWQGINREAFPGLKQDVWGERWGVSSLTFTDPMNGFALLRNCIMPACNMRLYVTHDGGISFQLVSESGTEKMNSPLNFWRPGDEIFFLNDHWGWFVGNQYSFQWTEDGGKTWNTQPLSENYFTINDIHMFTATDGIASGWGQSNPVYRGVIKTQDGGKTWQEMPLKNIVKVE